MKLATLRDGTRDGALAVVDDKTGRQRLVRDIAPTLQNALDHWDQVEPKLAAVAHALRLGDAAGEPFDVARLMAPLPRATEWIDGSAYVNHIVLVRKARGAEPPADLLENPLVYQGGSSDMLAPTQDLELPDPSWGMDFESEVVVVLGDTPRGTTAAQAGQYIRLVGICNDVTYRNLVPGELVKGFGFFQSKPATAFSPLFVTPDELGPAWREGRLHLPLRTEWNGALAGDPHAGPEMHFSFHDLIAHIARTRRFGAGTILGSGTVSNQDPARGISCIAERRMRETLEQGGPKTRFLEVGDRVRIEMLDAEGKSLFGAIDQKVVAA